MSDRDASSSMVTAETDVTIQYMTGCEEERSGTVMSAESVSHATPTLKHRLRSRLPFGRQKDKSQGTTRGSDGCSGCRTENKKKTGGRGWAFKLCARTDSTLSIDSGHSAAAGHSSVGPCVCTAYRRTDDSVPLTEFPLEESQTPASSSSSPSSPSTRSDPISRSLHPSVHPVPVSAESSSSQDRRPASPPIPALDHVNNLVRVAPVRMLQNSPADSRSGAPHHQAPAQVRVSELAIALRNQLASVSPYPYVARWGDGSPGPAISSSVTEVVPPSIFSRFCARIGTDNFVPPISDSSAAAPQFHSQAEYIHRLVPDMMQISNCSFYWGKMDRYEAEKLLDNKPEGTFLLRDSAQEEHLFSVSFRRFDRSLHARIEQWNNRFSFDSHDPGVFSSSTVCGLIEHYKDPSHCMFFEPMLTIPLHRKSPFSLQHLCRTTLCSRLTYDSVNLLPLPKRIRSFLKEYHYRQQVRMRFLEP